MRRLTGFATIAALALTGAACGGGGERQDADEPEGEYRLEVVDAYVGDRSNRRHKPGRALERPRYRFDVLADYGAFRDLQRHRTLTIEWQVSSPPPIFNFDNVPTVVGGPYEYGVPGAVHGVLKGAEVPQPAGATASGADHGSASSSAGKDEG